MSDILGSLRRALFPPRPGPQDASAIGDWARRRSFAFKRARGEEGFVIEGRLEDKPWRLEWGAPQRPYIEGHELRLRMEAGLPGSLQMLVLSQGLMAELEHRTFEDFTDTLQTQVGTSSPEEMRWLVLHPKVDLDQAGEVGRLFGVVANLPANGLGWVSGLLGRMLETESTEPGGLLQGAPPFVLMTLRGKVYLRMRLERPEPRHVGAALALFETAVARAIELAGQGARPRPKTAGGPSAS